MKRVVTALRVMFLALALALAATGRAQAQPEKSASPDSIVASDGQTDVRSAIERHLGRPYVWGASGLKSFDCSGFVWRVMQENGILIKRTTARKFYMCLPKVDPSESWTFGNIVFFSNLEHCGIVDSKETFYHAAVSKGTSLTSFDPLWRRKVTGVRAMPKLRGQGEGRD